MEQRPPSLGPALRGSALTPPPFLTVRANRVRAPPPMPKQGSAGAGRAPAAGRAAGLRGAGLRPRGRPRAARAPCAPAGRRDAYFSQSVRERGAGPGHAAWGTRREPVQPPLPAAVANFARAAAARPRDAPGKEPERQIARKSWAPSGRATCGAPAPRAVLAAALRPSPARAPVPGPDGAGPRSSGRGPCCESPASRSRGRVQWAGS